MKASVLVMSVLAHQSIQSDDQRDPRVGGSAAPQISSRTATALVARSSITAKTAAHKVLDPEPRGYSEDEKERVIRAYRKRGSKRAISRIFGISRNTVNRWLEKKGREAGSVAEGLRPTRDSDTLELDECWTHVWKQSNKRWLWVALCRRTRQVVAFVIGDRSAKTCAQLWSRIQRSHSSRTTGRAEALATSGSPIGQCSRSTQLTGRSESPAVSWPTPNAFSGGFGRS